MDYDSLERLVSLRNQGALSAEEFAEQKRMLLAGDQIEFQVQAAEARRPSGDTLLRKVSALSFVVGFCAVVYSTFIYDTTISPTSAWSADSSVNEYSSIEDRARAVSEIADRYQRTLAGERIINFPRVETQRRIFSLGALLLILGALGLIVPMIRKRT